MTPENKHVKWQRIIHLKSLIRLEEQSLPTADAEKLRAQIAEIEVEKEVIQTELTEVGEHYKKLMGQLHGEQ